MFRSSFDKNLENATSHLRLEPDWPSILLICDEINQKDVTPKNAFIAIKKKMNSPNPHSSFYALLVLESIVKNCGSPVHEEVFTKENCEMFSNFLEQTPHENVRQKILELVQTWAYAFRSSEKYQAIKDTMTILKAKGKTFPELKEADAMFSADTAPNWSDGKVCHRCRVEFTFTNRKHHCRNCGQVFCGQCTAKQCPLPKYGIEKDVRVCDGCFASLQRPAIKASTRSIDSDLPAEYLNSSLSQQVQTPPRKTEQELKEEEELQLALALSQSEAEQKKQQKAKQSLATAAYRLPQRSPSPEAPPAPKEIQQEETNPDLAKYLNRSYWEQRKVNDSPMASPSAPSPMPPTPQPQQMLPSLPNTADEVQIDEFAANMRTQVEIFVNRMKSNSSRGRSISNDSSVQTLFMTLTSLHSQQLSYIKEMDDKRMWYEQLQDKLVQIKDSRAALDVLRQEHVDKLRRIAEENERQRQLQMAQKLEIMRKKKQEYLQYQRQLALQRIQEQEREMQMRQEQQKAQYLMGQGAPFPFIPAVGGAAAVHGVPLQTMHNSPSHQLNSVYNPYAGYQTQSPVAGQLNSLQSGGPQLSQNATSIPPGMFNPAMQASNQQTPHPGMILGQTNNVPQQIAPPNGQMLPQQLPENNQIPNTQPNMQPTMPVSQPQLPQQQQHVPVPQQQHVPVPQQQQQHVPVPQQQQQHVPIPQQQQHVPVPQHQQHVPVPQQQQHVQVPQQQIQSMPQHPQQQQVQPPQQQLAHVMLQQQQVVQTHSPIAPPQTIAPPAAPAAVITTNANNAVGNSQVQAIAAAPAPPQNEPEPATAPAEPATAELICFD